MKRYILLGLCILQLAGCITYRNNDDGVGALKELHSLKELEGTYASKAIFDSYERKYGKSKYENSYNQLAHHLYSKQIPNWRIEQIGSLRFVRIVYVNDTQMHFQALDAQGALLGEVDVFSPKDFTFENGTMYFRGYDETSRNISGPHRSDYYWTLNAKNNLVAKIEVISEDPVLLMWYHRLEYKEYQRVQ